MYENRHLFRKNVLKRLDSMCGNIVMSAFPESIALFTITVLRKEMMVLF